MLVAQAMWVFEMYFGKNDMTHRPEPAVRQRP
jgi:hypothetical protein